MLVLGAGASLAFSVVQRVLVTGMSGTGKSTVLAELARRGFEAVDTDEPGWTRWSDEDDGYVWVEERMAELLSQDRPTTLYVSSATTSDGERCFFISDAFL